MPRALAFTFFLAVFSAFLFVANWVVFEALVVLLAVTGAAEFFLGLGLGILSASFIAATLLSNWYYSLYSRAYYWIASVWIGAFCYLFLAAVAYGIAVGVWPGNPDALAPFGLLLFAAAAGAGVYGVLHARRLVVNRVTITLPRLPRTWEGRRAAWISDLHLGPLHGPSFAKKVVDTVQRLAPEIIFIGGDLYDGTQAPDARSLVAPLRALRARLGVYFITGNHEHYGGNKVFLEAVHAAGISVLHNTALDIEGVQLVGLDHFSTAKKNELESVLAGLTLDRMRPAILLKHEPDNLSTAEAAGVSLQISGHTHRGQQWPFGYVAQLIFKGHAYGLTFFKNMQVLVSSGVGTWGPPLRVGSNSEVLLITFAAKK